MDYTIDKKPRYTKTVVKIYVNGKPLPWDWNEFTTIESAFNQIKQGNIVGINILLDDVQIREITEKYFQVDFE